MKKQRDDKQPEVTANNDTHRINYGRTSLMVTQRGDRQAHRCGTKQVMKKAVAESQKDALDLDPELRQHTQCENSRQKKEFLRKTR